MDLRFHTVDAHHLLRVDATGKIDLPATVRMAREIAAFGGEAAHLPVLLDVRALQGRLSVLEMVELVKLLVVESQRYQRKLALLTRADEQLERARFMQLYSLNRGIPIAAFSDYDQAVDWLTSH
jgi:hypothetical protein